MWYLDRTAGMNEEQIIDLLIKEPILFSKLINDRTMRNLKSEENLLILKNSLRKRLSDMSTLFLLSRTEAEEKYYDEYGELPFG